MTEYSKIKCEVCGRTDGDKHNTGLNYTGTWYCGEHYWNYLQNL